MSIEATNWAWGIRGISPTEKVVLARLADRADAAGLCFPGQASLGADCCVAIRALRNALQRLIDSGLVTVARPSTPTESTRYRLNVGATPAPRAGGAPRAGEAPRAGGEGYVMPEGGAPRAGGGRHDVPVNHQGTIREPSANPHAAVAAGGGGHEERKGQETGSRKPEAAQEPSGMLPGIDTLAGGKNPTAPPSRAKSKPPRKRDELSDALLVATGTKDPTRAAWQEIRAAAVAINGIRFSNPDVTPEEIHRRAANYREAWPNIRITPQGLAKHWSRFETGDLAKEAARLREEIAKHPANPSSVYHESDCPKAKRAEFRELRRRLAEIEAQLGGGRHD